MPCNECQPRLAIWVRRWLVVSYGVSVIGASGCKINLLVLV